VSGGGNHKDVIREPTRVASRAIQPAPRSFDDRVTLRVDPEIGHRLQPRPWVFGTS